MFRKYSVLIVVCLMAVLCVQSHAQSTPALSPASGSILGGANVTFSWTAAGGSSAYALYLGTTGVGSHNLFSSGSMSGSSVNVSGLPTGGQTIYARWEWRVGSTWSVADYTYTEAGSPVAPALLSPVSTTLDGSTAQFSWTPGSGATAYALFVGTTGVGSQNLFHSGSTMATSAMVTNIPQGGQILYVRLQWLLGSTWQTADYTDTEAGSPVPAALTTPTPGTGTRLTGSTQFSWSAGQGPTLYQLNLGTTGIGSKNIFASGGVTATTVAVSNIPQNGVLIFARLYWLMGATWQYADYQYTEGGTPVAPVLQSPVSTTLSGSSANFVWTAGVGPTYYLLYVGSAGPGSRDIYTSGATTSTSVTLNNLPQNGVTLYVRLNWEINGAWQYADYTDMEAGTSAPPLLTTPAPGSTLPSQSSVSFSWTPGTGPTYYRIYVGNTGVGSGNLYISPIATATTAIAPDIPQTGATLFVRLYWIINDAWQHADYQYTEAGTVVTPVLTTPAPSSTLNSSTATFTWSAGTGPVYYGLYLGTMGVGTNDILNTGVTTATSETVTDLPITGGTIYARLLWQVNGVWSHTDYTYNTVSGQIVSPVPGSVFSGSSETFTWTGAGGINAYVLHLGTSPGASNLYTSSVTSSNSVTVTGLPTNGATVYATLDWELNGVWQATSYTYTEASVTSAATLTSPTNGSTLTGASETFDWTTGSGVTAYELKLGTSGPNSSNVYDSGSTTNTTVNVTGIPTGGQSWGTMDSWLECTGQTPGTTITTALLTACATDDAPSDYSLSEDPLTPMQFAASQGGLGGSVVVSSTTYPATTATTAISYDHEYGGQYFSYGIPYGTNAYVLNMNGYLTFGPPASGATDVVFDYLVAQDINGQHPFVIQLHTGTFEGCTYCVFLETSPGYVVTNSASGIPVSPNTRYAFSVQGNENTGVASLAIYDPSSSFTQIGTTITSAAPTANQINYVLVGNTLNSQASGSISYFEDLMLDWNGNTTFPNIPQAATLYGTLSSEIGGVWQSVNYTFTESH